MPRRKKHPKLPNGYGSIKYLGAGRTNPYAVHPPTTEFTLDGIPKTPKALCYVDDWYKGFTVLTWYRNGEYYPGREKELSSDAEELQRQVSGILAKYNQTQREAADQKTFREVYEAYYLWKFKKPYDNKEKKTSMEYSMRAAFKNCQELHDLSFKSLTAATLQNVVDSCPLKHSSLELIVTLFHQMYAYAEANNLVEKDYSKYVQINIEDDDEHGESFTETDLKKLWKNKAHPVVEMLLIMCYSGFRISAYKDLEVNLKEKYFKGGLKTAAGKDRFVPIHSGIMELVKKRIKRDGALLTTSENHFRLAMYDTLEELKIEPHTPHDCRHTFSALCEKYKVNENDRKRMLGHAFQDVTNRVYGHRELDDLREEIEKIEICY